MTNTRSRSLSSPRTSRGASFRNAVLGAAVVGAVGIAGVGGYMYYRNNSPTQLATRAQLALDQRDPARAIDYLQRALAKNPGGETGIGLRLLMARALLDQEREDDAREFLAQILAEKPDSYDALDLRARSYVIPTYAALRKKPKPLTAPDAASLYELIEANGKKIDGLVASENRKITTRELIAQAELSRLRFLILRDQGEQTKAQLDSATLAADANAVRRLTQQAGEIEAQRARYQKESVAKLEAAYAAEPTHTGASSLLAQYRQQDGLYAEAVQLYEELKARDAAKVPEEVALAAAQSLQRDEKKNPTQAARLAASRRLLEEYLQAHPKSTRTMVALGDVLLDQKEIGEAAKMAERAIQEAPNELYTQVLLVNCRMAERKTAEALQLLGPLSTTFDNRPEVWYLLGLAHNDQGDKAAAENAFRKALAVSPRYTEAREALLDIEIDKGTVEAAVATATQVLRENRYNFRAWQVTVDVLRRRGQEARAGQLMLGLAEDKQLPPDRVAELARFLIVNGEAGEAEKLARRLPPDDPATMDLTALIMAARGNNAGARAVMAKAIAAAPTVERRLQYAELLAKANLVADFRAQLDAIVASGQALTAPQAVMVARNYLRVSRPHQALAVLKPLADKNNSDAQSLTREAQALLADGPGAQTPSDAPADPQQASMDDLLRRGEAALGARKFEDALTIARQGLTRNKDSSELYQIAARALAGMGQTTQAVEDAVAAAAAEPYNIRPYEVFVGLFDEKTANKGIGYGGRFDKINAALGNWAMGKLAEKSGSPDLALRYYNSGMEATTRLTEPRASKEHLYRAIVTLHAQRKDLAALNRTADAVAAADAQFLPGARLIAYEALVAAGEREEAGKQLGALSERITPTTPSRLVLFVADAWRNIQQPQKALALIEKQVAAAPNDSELLDGYATLLAQNGQVDKAVGVRTQLCTMNPGEPKFRVSLAQTQAIAGDYPAAFATLDAAAAMGATGKQLASAARIRQLLALGLLNEVTRELQARGSSADKDDFATALAVAQAWAQVDKQDEARKLAATIPAYAAEYTGAQVLIAAMDTDKGDFAAAIRSLTELGRKHESLAPLAAPQLFLAYIRAGDAKAALELAQAQKGNHAERSPGSREWLKLAATAAREGKQYAAAVSLLSEDPELHRAAGLDIALLNLLQNKPAGTGAAVNDDAPAFNKTTLALLSGTQADAAATSKLLSGGRASAVLAALAMTPAAQLPAALQQTAANPHVYTADMESLVKALGSEPAAKLRTLALTQRLLEAGWSTTALELATELEKSTPAAAYAAVQRHQALTDLRRTKVANALRDTWAARLKEADLPPSMRLLAAASYAKEDRYQEALAAVQPLAGLKRPEILTTIASLHEKLGELEKAVAIHRQLRQMNANDVGAANNLAYTLAMSQRGNASAMEEALRSIQFAIAQQPNVTAFQDTLGWIEILAGDAAQGTRRIAQVAPSLRLDPAVHYHLGVGYAKIGKVEFARMHLQNVAHLAKGNKQIPELELATKELNQLASAR